MNKYRIIDASINRASEGIRVIEDIIRFDYNNKVLTEELRNLRHSIRKSYDIDSNIFARDSENDFGVDISISNDELCFRSTVLELISSNFKRVQEALRTLEEVFKILNGNFRRYEKLRYKLYNLEKKVHLEIWQLKFERGIYAVTEDTVKISHLDQIYRFLESGIKVIQYRNKTNDDYGLRLKNAIYMKKACEKYGAILIINDDFKLAIDSKSDGIHLGQEDILEFDFEKLNNYKINNPNFILGISTHNKNQAIDALERGADYIGVGPIYHTTTRVHVEKCEGISYLRWVNKNIGIPYVAIGGIKKDKAKELKQNGAKICAMVTELNDYEDLDELVEIFLNKSIRY